MEEGTPGRSQAAPRSSAPSLATIDSKLESQWKEAFDQENCLLIMKLLKKDPRFAREGWTSKPIEAVEGSSLRTQRRWMAETALHVGARKGCAGLVEQVLELCSLNHDDGSLGEKITGGDRRLEHKTVAHWRSQTDHARARRTLARWKRKLTEVDERNLKRTAGDLDVDLNQLLLSRDAVHNLDALAIAVLNGNVDVIELLMIGSNNCRSAFDPNVRTNPYSIHMSSIAFCKGDEEHRAEEHRANLAKITEEVISSYSNNPVFHMTCLEAYSDHTEFNFLPRNLYLFHFLFTNGFGEVLDEKGGRILHSSQQVHRVLYEVLELLWGKVTQFPSSLWRFLLELRDGQGRTPLHVAVDEGTVWGFRKTILQGDELPKEVVSCAMTASDGAGRTALHRAVILGGSSDTALLLKEMMDRTDLDIWKSLNAACEHTVLDLLQSRTSYTFTLEGLSDRAKFQGLGRKVNVKDSNRSFKEERMYLQMSTPLQSAIIHRRANILRCLLEEVEDKDKVSQHRPLPCRVRTVGEEFFGYMGPLELAALVGEPSIVKMLVEFGIQGTPQQPHADNSTREKSSSYNSDGEKSSTDKSTQEKSSSKKTWRSPSGLHIAAAAGNYEILKLFLDHRLYSPFVEDLDENTALHYAMKGREAIIDTNFLDYVDCKQIVSSQEHDTKYCLDTHARRCLAYESFFVARQGCIDLLIQAGCDIFKSNKKHEVPSPGPDLSLNAKFLSWWYDKQAKEFANVQNTLNGAANSVSITAALVATASYVGPLQPPLGYSGSSNQIQVDNIWVRIFIVCDTLSFYLAIAAIIFSLIPSLPMPQQSMMDELRRTLKMVTLAVAILFPSIVLVLVAFAASSIAVVSADIGASSLGYLTICTAASGGFVCVIAIFLFFIRLIGFVFNRVPWIRHIYNATSF